jgi:hypothetical protein
LQITLFTFKGQNLLILSLISTFFVPLDVPNEELQNIFEAYEQYNNVQKVVNIILKCLVVGLIN